MMDMRWTQYAILYPFPWEDGYDGIHNGGIKCLQDDAPQWARDKYEEYLAAEAEGEKL